MRESLEKIRPSSKSDVAVLRFLTVTDEISHSGCMHEPAWVDCPGEGGIDGAQIRTEGLAR